MKLKRIVVLSVLLASAVVIGYIESFIPAFFIPGVKLGLANIVILLCILNFKWYEALIISILRCIIVSLIVGTFLNISFLMSISGALFSLIGMEIIVKTKFKFIVFTSAIGSILHSVGQIIMASIIMSTTSIFYYLPFILLLSIPTGLFVGFVVSKIQKTNVIAKTLNNYEIDEYNNIEN